MNANGYAPGTRVVIRDEEWLVRRSVRTDHDGVQVEVLGESELVRGTEATFFSKLDRITELLPEATRLVTESSPRFVHSRLFLEAVLRRTPLPRTERGLAMADDFLINSKTFQKRPAELALRGLRPRILIADVVGLGKTLEIGLTLAELIRRGRGDRILVVTPQHVLEQFQREMWTRFAIPLLRLDSVGIARVQQKLPAGRNPFTVHKRVIISVDTLKSERNYRHHLENLHWDAVVIDESHNLISSGTVSQRARLARLLATRTEALILASATPHNGDAASFAGLIDLLDPTVIADKTDYSATDLEGLYIRRTKVEPEVRNEIGDDWKERGPTRSLHVSATPEEEAVFAELTKTWFAGDESVVGAQRRLFPFTLLKSFLSSPKALSDTVSARLRRLDLAAADRDAEVRAAVKKGDEVETLELRNRVADTREDAERQALHRLRDLSNEVTAPAKLTALVDHLRSLGVGPRSATRVVVFSERVKTIEWLAATVGPALGLKDDQTQILHGGLSDVQQQRVVEDFALAKAPVRLLFTGDVASEGVNLHSQCHQLVHFDIPWSLIRIEQRNGRIDRYGQRQHPQFTALLLKSDVDGARDDTSVAQRLLEREEQAHRALGTAEALTGSFDAGREEERLTKALVGKPIDEVLAQVEQQAALDPLAALIAGDATARVPDAPARVVTPRLFTDTEQFVTAAMNQLVTGADFEPDNGVLLMTPPDDLKKRLNLLPPGYLKDRKVLERLKVTTDKRAATTWLDRAKQAEDTAWPEVAYLSDLHPLVDWLVDKALLRLGRGKAPVITCNVSAPTFALQGVYTNRAGQATVVQWMAITGLPDAPQVTDLIPVLDAAGVGPDMVNAGIKPDLEPLQELVPVAVAAAKQYLDDRRGDWDAEVAAEIERHTNRVGSWKQRAIDGLAETPGRAGRADGITDTARSQQDRIAMLATDGLPLLRLLAVLAPTGDHR